MSLDEPDAVAQATAANHFAADVYLGFESHTEPAATVQFYRVPTFESAGGRSLAELIAKPSWSTRRFGSRSSRNAPSNAARNQNACGAMHHRTGPRGYRCWSSHRHRRLWKLWNSGSHALLESLSTALSTRCVQPST